MCQELHGVSRWFGVGTCLVFWWWVQVLLPPPDHGERGFDPTVERITVKLKLTAQRSRTMHQTNFPAAPKLPICSLYAGIEASGDDVREFGPHFVMAQVTKAVEEHNIHKGFKVILRFMFLRSVSKKLDKHELPCALRMMRKEGRQREV